MKDLLTITSSAFPNIDMNDGLVISQGVRWRSHRLYRHLLSALHNIAELPTNIYPQPRPNASNAISIEFNRTEPYEIWLHSALRTWRQTAYLNQNKIPLKDLELRERLGNIPVSTLFPEVLGILLEMLKYSMECLEIFPHWECWNSGMLECWNAGTQAMIDLSVLVQYIDRHSECVQACLATRVRSKNGGNSDS